MSKIIAFPNNIYDKSVYLRINMKTLDSNFNMEKVANLLKEDLKTTAKYTLLTTGKIYENLPSLSDVTNMVKKNQTTTVNKHINTASESIFTEIGKGIEVKEIDVFKDSTVQFSLDTYIPHDFIINMIGEWETANISTGLQGLIQLGSKTPIVGGLLETVYNKVKNNLANASSTSINPKEIKIYKPTFSDFTLNFEYNPNSLQEAKDIENIVLLFKEAMIPTNNTNQEIFEYPAVFDIEIIVNNDDEITTAETKTDKLFDHLTSKRTFGLVSFDGKPRNGENKDLQTRKDGRMMGWDLTMSFTSIQKTFRNSVSLSNRLTSLIKDM